MSTSSGDQVHPPTDSHPGTVAEGRYKFEDNTVTLVDHLDRPIKDKDGKAYSKKLTEGECHRTIAGRLTKTVRSARRGPSHGPEGFSRVIVYPRNGSIV
jgi:hypothetical protein